MDFSFFKSNLPAHLQSVTEHCKHHGGYQTLKDANTGEVAAGCPDCQDELDIARIQSERIQHLYRIAGIPSIYKNKGLSDYETNEESQALALRSSKVFVENYVSNPNRSLIVTGSPGTGKTHLSIGIIKNLIALGLHCRYTTLNDMLSEIKCTYSSASMKTEGEIIESYIAPAVLVIDELGISQLSRSDEGLLYQIINGRYVEGRATVIVSNLDAQNLIHTIGDRLLDRLREGGGILIDMQHKSYRR